MFFNEKRVLHIPCRMFLREIESGEHVPVVFNLGTFRNRKAQFVENRQDFILHNGQRMTASQLLPVARQGQIRSRLSGIRIAQAVLQLVHLCQRHRLQVIQRLPDFLLLLCRHLLEIVKQNGNAALFTQMLDTELLHFFRRGRRETFDFCY